MKVLILQPPVAQLNTAYPSGAYLSAYFKSLGFETEWHDLNISLFYSIFSKEGLAKLFSLCSADALCFAAEAEKKGDDSTAFNLRRYVSQKNLWIEWIDTITSVLRADKSGYENAHRFVFGAHVPRGNRMESFLSNLDHDLTTDDARSLASCAVADLADFITFAFDKNFALVRYAESLTVSESSFEEIAKGADSAVLREFYVPVLERLVGGSNIISESESASGSSEKKKLLVCISVPFAGTFTPALCTGKFLKRRFGSDIFVCMGGGFINTELRSVNERLLSQYCDALCYDRGYASYRQLAESRILDKGSDTDSLVSGGGFYKLRFFLSDGSVTDVIESDTESELYEKKMTSSLVPDFSDIDFSIYPRLIDDTNPMHRLWSDGAWIKAYMAHGCYWHKCAFCDVTLDYVRSFCMTDIKRLYEGLLRQAEEKDVFGIHFVDEAMPPVAMVEFARENIRHGSPLTWWGNIRFEKAFTRDVADYLACGGLIGVSAGLESATGSGLDEINKGTDLKSIASACCAFKEAGILVHAYMIYGYWKETPSDLMNSMETLRQFYENGLLDSSFWHKFVLTKHSRVYKEWKEGKFRDLVPVETDSRKRPLFSGNGLHFEGERKSEKFGRALDYSLERWMHGQDLRKPVQKWFDFPVPKPTVPADYVSSLIAEYEKDRDSQFAQPVPENRNRVIWLGGEKIPAGKNRLCWTYMGEMFTAPADEPEIKLRGKGLCVLPDWPCLR